MNAVLAPLAARYTSWLELPDHAVADIRNEDPDQVRAMPVILRIEKRDPPDRAALLEAAATAAVLVCVDPRAQQGGEWHDEVAAWVAGRIRKVSRRARGVQWEAVQELPGVTVEVAGAQARALVPCRVVETPKAVAKLQISGSELPDDPRAVRPPEDVPELLLNPGVPMTVGKAAAQVGHATMILASALDEAALARWSELGYRCVVRTPSAEEWAGVHPGADPEGAWRDRRVVAVRDAGFTEVDPGTVTVLARWP